MESPRCSLKSSTNPNLAIAHWRNVTTRMRRKRKTLHRMERTENRCMKRVRSRIFKPSERFWRNEFYSNIRFFKSVWMYLSNQISTNSRYNWNRYALKHWRRKNNAWNIYIFFQKQRCRHRKPLRGFGRKETACTAFSTSPLHFRMPIKIILKTYGNQITLRKRQYSLRQKCLDFIQ